MTANHQVSELSGVETALGRLPDGLTQYTGFLLGKAHQRVSELLQGLCREIGLGTDIKLAGVLHVLRDMGPMSQQQVGKTLRVDRTSMVQLVDNLEKRQLVQRTINPADRRAYILEITIKGRERLAALEKRSLNLEAKLLPGFSTTEREVVRRALISLANLEAL